MRDKIEKSYHQSKAIYDDILTQGKWWSKLYIKLFWQGVSDIEIANKILAFIPNDFAGKLLDVPVGTAVFTWRKYLLLKNATITCLDYSADMLSQAIERFKNNGIKNIMATQSDVSNLPFPDETFDIVLSMNGFHAFPYKDKAFTETHRVLKKGGLFIACFYIKGESKVTDILVEKVLSKKGWFSPPFDTARTLKIKLEEMYYISQFQIEGSMVYFCARKKADVTM